LRFSIGNALEWYDISSYGYFAVYVPKAFFPNIDPAISLLLPSVPSGWRCFFLQTCLRHSRQFGRRR